MKRITTLGGMMISKSDRILVLCAVAHDGPSAEWGVKVQFALLLPKG